MAKVILMMILLMPKPDYSQHRMMSGAFPGEQTTNVMAMPGSSWVAIWENRQNRSMHASDCIQILSSGFYHREHRRQEDRNDTTEVFESWLSTTQLDQLQGIIDSDKVRLLPRFVSPPLPILVSIFHVVTADVVRGNEVQEAGYFSWEGDVPLESSPASTPKSVKQRWRDSELALSPLIDWFHGIEMLNLPPVNKPETNCGAE